MTDSITTSTHPSPLCGSRDSAFLPVGWLKLSCSQHFLHFVSCFRFFCPHLAACGILVPQPGIKPVLPAVEAQSLNHWTAREVPALPSETAPSSAASKASLPPGTRPCPLAHSVTPLELSPCSLHYHFPPSPASLQLASKQLVISPFLNSFLTSSFSFYCPISLLPFTTKLPERFVCIVSNSFPLKNFLLLHG